MKCKKCGRGELVWYVPPVELYDWNRYPYHNNPQKCGYCGELHF